MSSETLPHEFNEHLWKWGKNNDDETFAHGPCVVKGCSEPGEDRVPLTSSRDLFVRSLPAEEQK